ncbi:MAG: tetratricopeptide repeat protein [Planctomycetaceae bacterium]
MGSSSTDLLNVAIEHHRSGRLVEAERVYREILSREPNHADAMQLLGTLADQCGHHQQGVELISRAIQISPRPLAGWHNNLGEAHRKLKQFGEAEAAYRRAIKTDAKHAGAHNNLGLILQETGRTNEAVRKFERALELQLDFAETHRNLATALHRLGETERALHHLRRAVQIRPSYPKAQHALGLLLHETGDHDGAIEALRQTVSLTPNDADAQHALGIVLHESGRSDEAVTHMQRAVQLRPDMAEAHHDLAGLLRQQKRLNEAIVHFREALRINPHSAGGHANLARALQQNGDLIHATTEFRRALDLDPSLHSAQGALVHALQHQCDWRDLADQTRLTIQSIDSSNLLGQTISPFIGLTLSEPTSTAQQLACAKAWVAQNLAAWQRRAPLFHQPRTPRADGRIVLGYLSADFHQHATADLAAEMFEQHDRERFAVHAYCYGPDDQSPMRQRLLNAFDRYEHIGGLSHEQAARKIAADGVDILIDLKGYTEHARPQIPALRPAPIQVNYLGYPGTMGADFIDYILVDDVIVPASEQPHFTERLVHLPGCYQVNDSRRAVAEQTPSRADCGLPDEGFVFCCFNNNYKLTPAVFDVWMRLLHSIPGSVLWLLEAHRVAADNLRREAESRGVSSDRLVFAPRCPPHQHRARYRLADLFIDTFPVNAHTTASEALAADCPLVTIAGDTFISRVAASLLQALNLPDLICTNLDDYEVRILALSQHPDQLADIRHRLRTARQATNVFDGTHFARNLELAYLTMWKFHQSGEEPQPYVVAS